MKNYKERNRIIVGEKPPKEILSDLNIKKLWRLYNNTVESENLKVKESFFRKELNKNYNIGFGNPKSDVCSTCLEFSEKMKNVKTEKEKSELMIGKRIHTMKYNAFYSYLRQESENTISISFDCQKNLLLPKLPDQSAYFSRQINAYNFTVTIGSSKSPLNKENVHIYTWNESDFVKGSNEIASALNHTLNNINLSDKNVLKLFADGCVGQNKNSIIIGMLSKWLLSAPLNLITVEIYFPVVGHSFLPPDRVFAKIEKETRKKEIILQPETYNEILSDHGTVFQLGVDVPVLDWKAATRDTLKAVGSWHFQFSSAKRMFLFRRNGNIMIQGEVSYKFNVGVPKSVLKRMKNLSIMRPQQIERGQVSIKPEKIRDVCKLLEKHYGADWRQLQSLQFFVRIEDQLRENVKNVEEDEEIEQFCEPREEIDFSV